MNKVVIWQRVKAYCIEYIFYFLLTLSVAIFLICGIVSDGIIGVTILVIILCIIFSVTLFRHYIKLYFIIKDVLCGHVVNKKIKIDVISEDLKANIERPNKHKKAKYRIVDSNGDEYRFLITENLYCKEAEDFDFDNEFNIMYLKHSRLLININIALKKGEKKFRHDMTERKHYVKESRYNKKERYKYEIE